MIRIPDGDKELAINLAQRTAQLALVNTLNANTRMLLIVLATSTLPTTVLYFRAIFGAD